MNAEPKNCDVDRIDAYLDGHMTNDDTGGLNEHLESCVSCREYMERRAAGQGDWREAAELLQRDEFDGEPFLESCSSTSAVNQSTGAQNSGMIQAVLDSLAPSEDPHRLGRLGIYEITGVVGSGGMGVVLKAIDPSLDRTVAIKVMSPWLVGAGAARKRFAREAKAAAAVLHPNVVSIHGVSPDDALPYLVMTYISGGSLQKRLADEGPFTTAEVLRIGSQVAAGLAAAHDQGLVHRDIKPANIMLEQGVERIAITDFGLARAVDDASITREGVVAGTPQYMSPEQARGESVDQRSDLFSLGSVLYALATGRPPFRASSSFGVMRKICDETPVPIQELNPDIPRWLCKVIEKLMTATPDDRFASAREVSQLLESSLAHVQQPTGVPLPKAVGELAKKSNRPFRFSRGTIIMGSFVGAAMCALLCFLPGKQDFAPRDKEAKQVAQKLAHWKERALGSDGEAQQQKQLLTLHRRQLIAPSGLGEVTQETAENAKERFLRTKRVWATELLPILLAGVESDKAEFLVEFTEPFEAIREADIAAAGGATTEPVGWEWQAVHMLALGRQGRITDAYTESDLLTRKIQVNIDNGGGKNLEADFFGRARSFEEILRECRLHRAVMQAINGPASAGTGEDVKSEGERSSVGGSSQPEVNHEYKYRALQNAVFSCRAKVGRLIQESPLKVIEALVVVRKMREQVVQSGLEERQSKPLLTLIDRDIESLESAESWSGISSITRKKLGLIRDLSITLAAIPDRPSLLQADENFLAIFELSGDEMIAKAVRGDEEAARLGVACWNRITTLFPSGYRKGLVQFNIQGGRRWAGFFNGGGSNDVGRKGYSLSIAKYLALAEPGVNDPNRPLTAHRGSLDWTTVHEMGHYICLKTDAIELFSLTFDGDDHRQPLRRENPDDYPMDGSPVLNGNFVTSYAERTPGDEEVCETFTTYLLVKKLPTNDSLVAKKIRFFELLVGYPALRKHIQNAVRK